MTDRSQRPAVFPFTGLRLDMAPGVPLSNGAMLWTVGGGSQRVCRVSVFLPGGTLHETAPLQALMTATMALEGSRRFAPDDIAEQLDYHGAWKAAQCHDGFTEFSLSMPCEYYGRLLPILADAVAAPVFPEAELEVCRRRFVAYYAAQCERVKYLAGAELRRLYYGAASPLAVLVRPDDAMRLTVDDLRDFAGRHFGPEHCRMILSGDLSEQMIDLTAETFGRWRREAGGAALDPATTPDPDPAPPGVSVIDKPGAVQAAIAVAIPAVGRNHQDYLKLRVLCTVLGGHIGSRLMASVREQKGYTYGIHASLSGRAGDGYVAIGTECSTEHVRPVMEQIKVEMRRLRDDLIPENELNQARQFMLADQARVPDTPFGVAGYVASTFLVGIYPEYYNRQIDTIQSVTAHELRDMARRYLDQEQMRVAIAGDKAKFA